MLVVLIPFFNPCGYTRLKNNAEFCVSQLVSQGTPRILFIEVVYVGDALKLIVPTLSPKLPKNVERLRIPCNSIMFHKESLLQIGYEYVKQSCTKIVAMDADILFENDHWYDIVSHDLNACDFLQPFENAKLLDTNMQVQKEKISWIKSYLENGKQHPATVNFQAHSGFLAAYNTSYLEKCGGFFQYCVQGGGDEIHIRKAASIQTIPERFVYLKELLITYLKPHNSKVGYSKLNVKHLYHGSMENRKYNQRHFSLMNSGFSLKDVNTKTKLPEFYDTTKWNTFFMNYFLSRKEDDTLHDTLLISTPIAEVQSIVTISEPPKENDETNHKQQQEQKNIKPVNGIGCFPFLHFNYHSKDEFIIHEEEDILVDVRTGIFNRIRVLLAALYAIKKTTNGKIWCHWPINKECSVTYESVCAPNLSIYWIKSAKQCFQFAKNFKTNRIFGELRPNARAPGALTVLKSLNIKIPDKFSIVMQNFRPSDKMFIQVNTRLRNLPPRPWIGLHIRRMDSVELSKKLNKSVREPKDYLDFAKSDLNATILLLTDDTDIIAWFGYHIGSRLVVLSDANKHPLIETPYGMRRDAGKSIVQDAIILSCADKFMGTDQSSVSELISYWNQSTVFTSQFARHL